ASAGGDELPVGLHDEGRGRGIVTGEVGDHPAAGSERGIQAAVRVVAGEREVARRDSRRDELAVGLQGQGEGDIGTVEIGDGKRAVARVGADEGGAEVGDDLARGAAGGVQRAIRVVAGDGDVAEADAGWVAVAVGVHRAALPVVLSSDAGPPFAGGHELPVTLEGERKGDVVARYTPAALAAVFVALALPRVPPPARAT